MTPSCFSFLWRRYRWPVFVLILLVAMALAWWINLLGGDPARIYRAFSRNRPAASPAFFPHTGYNRSLSRYVPIDGPTQLNLQWEYRTLFSIGFHGNASVAADGSMYAVDELGRLHCVDKDGEAKWVRMMFSNCTPLVLSDGRILAEGITQDLVALDQDGLRQWAVKHGEWGFDQDACEDADGNIVIGTYDTVYCLDRHGSLLWQFEAGSIITSDLPSMDHLGNLYWICESGEIHSLDQDGGLRWKQTYCSRSSHNSVAVVSDERIVFGGGDNYVWCFNLDGESLWQTDIKGNTGAIPAIDESGTAYIGTTNGHIYAIDSAGLTVWEKSIEHGIASSALITANGVVYFTTHPGLLLAISTADGTELDRHQIGGTYYMNSPTLTPDGAIITCSQDGVIRCFR